jgi:hypothetical protein
MADDRDPAAQAVDEALPIGMALITAEGRKQGSRRGPFEKYLRLTAPVRLGRGDRVRTFGL